MGEEPTWKFIRLSIILGLVEAGRGWSADTSRLQACRRGLSRWRFLCRRPSLSRAKDQGIVQGLRLRDNADGQARSVCSVCFTTCVQCVLHDLDNGGRGAAERRWCDSLQVYRIDNSLVGMRTALDHGW